MTNNRGFTLVEVMIAIAILAIGIGTILIAENNSLDVTLRAKRMTTVAMLAKNALIQAERELEGKTFEETNKETSGTFDAPYADYKWVRKVKEITFPNVLDAMGGDKKDEAVDEMTTRVVKVATHYLSKASREVSISIQWKEKNQDQEFNVSQYWVDLNYAFDINAQ